jgi:hypothetical protein
MGVKGEHMLMEVNGLTVVGGLTDEPLEQRQTILQALGMPLDTEDALVLTTLDGLDDSIGGGSGDAETLTGVIDCLMVEGVDVNGEW